MRRPVLSQTPRKRMMLTLIAILLAFIAAALVTFAASVAKGPAASAQEVNETDDVRSFSVRCDFSHRNTDDPIVYPGKPGAAHSHDFFGNRSTKYNSTYNKLLSASTTCLNPQDKSAYWIPTLKWDGKIVTARQGIFYYRAGHKDQTSVKALPAGLKVVPNTHVTWRCKGSTYTQVPPTQCLGGVLDVRIVAPDCSNGQIDSADHRSHMAYAVPQSNGTNICPDSHPTPVTALDMIIRFAIPTTPGKVTLSSGAASTMHADFFNAWDQATFEDLVVRCINEFTTLDARPEDCMAR